MDRKVNRWTRTLPGEEIKDRDAASAGPEREERAQRAPSSSCQPPRLSTTARRRPTHRLSDTLSPCSMTFVPIARDSTTLPLRAATRSATHVNEETQKANLRSSGALSTGRSHRTPRETRKWIHRGHCSDTF